MPRLHRRIARDFLSRPFAGPLKGLGRLRQTGRPWPRRVQRGRFDAERGEFEELSPIATPPRGASLRFPAAKLRKALWIGKSVSGALADSTQLSRGSCVFSIHFGNGFVHLSEPGPTLSYSFAVRALPHAAGADRSALPLRRGVSILCGLSSRRSPSRVAGQGHVPTCVVDRHSAGPEPRPGVVTQCTGLSSLITLR